MNATSLSSVEVFRGTQRAGCPIFAAGLSGLATLLLVAPCLPQPMLLALPAVGFVAMLRYGWRHERG
jgi:hypothetical protein